MKVILALFLTLSFVNICYAEKVDVNVNGIDPKSDGEDTTLIQIQKTKTIKELPTQHSKFAITEGQEDVIGDGAILSKQAKENWKKACKEWKAELKENNKGNQVLSSNCGLAVCASETNETVCRSKSTYKLKVKVDE